MDKFLQETGKLLLDEIPAQNETEKYGAELVIFSLITGEERKIEGTIELTREQVNKMQCLREPVEGLTEEINFVKIP